MRRKDRKIEDPNTIHAILAVTDHGHLSLCDNGEPYGVTLNYGHTFRNGMPVLYFHCAKEGRKIDILRNHPAAHFFVETDCQYHEGVSGGHKYYTMFYRSVSMAGTLEIVEDEQERRDALHLLMEKFPYNAPLEIAENSMRATMILKMNVHTCTGKQNPGPSAPSVEQRQIADNRVFMPSVQMPAWLTELMREEHTFVSAEARVRFTVTLATENVRRGTGGPFGAAVFERATGKLYAVGVNVVVPSGQSGMHAEMTAIANAQARFGSYDLAQGDFELVSSCEPCVMCFGGTLWSGVKSLRYGAPGTLASEIGFDEGDKVENWQESLRRRGIAVEGPILDIAETRAPFDEYRKGSGKIY